ncbi:MAG: hypothetical protein RR643_05670, partial [Anaerorhabdus sp.]
MKKTGIYFLCIFMLVASLTGCSSSKPKDEVTTDSGQKESVMIFDESKTYENEKYDSGKITGQNVTIKNMTFEQDLIIDKEVGDGNVYLDGVNIKGKLIINGGGKNSIHVDNCSLNAVESDRKEGAVHIVISENSSVDNFSIASETILDISGAVKTLNVSQSATGSTVDVKENAKVTGIVVNAAIDMSVKSPISQLDVNAGSNIAVESTITNLNITNGAQNTSITLGKDAVVSSLATETLVDISGQGKLEQVFTNNKDNITGTVKAESTTVSDNPISNAATQPSPSPTVEVKPTPQPTASPKPTVAPTQTPVPTVEPTAAPQPTATPIPTYTVSFVLGGYTVDPQTVKMGEKITKPDVTLGSDVYSGSKVLWVDEDGNVFDFNTPINSLKTLTGKIVVDVNDAATLETLLSEDKVHAITLTSDIQYLGKGIDINKNFSIYGNGYQITCDNQVVISVNESISLEIQSLKINATADISRGIFVKKDKDISITIVDSEIKSSDRGITFDGTAVKGDTQTVNLLIRNSKILNSKVTDYDSQVNYTTEIASTAGNRGISLFDSIGNVKIENSEILGFKYAVNVAGAAGASTLRTDLSIDVVNSTIKGWTAFNIWGVQGKYNIKNSTLVGIQNMVGRTNDFSTVVFNNDIYDIFGGNQAKSNVMLIENSTITNKQSEASIADGRKQQLIRVDGGLDKIQFKGDVKLIDTTGQISSAFYIDNMAPRLTQDFIRNNIDTSNATITCTSNGNSMDLIKNPYEVVEINNTEELISAIKNQSDSQIWNIKNGKYELPRNETIMYANQTGWFMPIISNDIMIFGEGNPIITTNEDAENGNHSSQNFITVVGNNVLIDGVEIIAQRDPKTQVATNKAIEVIGDNFELSNSKIKPHSDTSTYAGSIYLSNPGKVTTLNNVELLYGRISTSGANDKSKLILNDVLIDYAFSSLEKSPYFGFSNTAKAIIEANNCVLTIANLVGKDLVDQQAMLPAGMTIDKKESTMGVKNLEVTYTQVSENIVVKYDLPVGFTFDAPNVKNESELTVAYTKIFYGNDEEKSAAASIIGNDIIMYYYYKDSNGDVKPLLTKNNNPLVKNKLWSGHLNYYNEDGKTTTKLATGLVIEDNDTYVGINVPSQKRWTTSTNPSVDPATVSTGWLNAAKGNELFVTIAVIYDGRVYISDASINIPQDSNSAPAIQEMTIEIELEETLESKVDEETKDLPIDEPKEEPALQPEEETDTTTDGD